jgi:hypothetical protein
MKNVKAYMILILLITFNFSCEKQPFDFRNKYPGNWKFNISESHEVFNITRRFHDKTTFKPLPGEINYGSKHSTIRFQATGFSKEICIEKDGQIIPENV